MRQCHNNRKTNFSTGYTNVVMKLTYRVLMKNHLINFSRKHYRVIEYFHPVCRYTIEGLHVKYQNVLQHLLNFGNVK